MDILRALDIVPDGILGHSVGELGCAYADGCFTAEEMILSAYARGQASLESDLISGMMAAIGNVVINTIIQLLYSSFLVFSLRTVVFVLFFFFHQDWDTIK